MSRDGPGLLLRDALEGTPDVLAAAGRIAAARPDVIVLQGLDWDLEGRAVAALSDRIAEAGHPMPHALHPAGNRGVPAGDLDGDGRTDRAADMHGWAMFRGQGALAVLSRFPLSLEADLSGLLWRDMPGGAAPGADGSDLLAGPFAALRLSTTAHVAVRVAAPDGPLTLLVHHATPPVFDGPEDRNGRRAAAELGVWGAFLDGKLSNVPGGAPPPEGPVALAFAANVDPVDGDGPGEALRAFLARPDIVDPRPRGGGASEPPDGHRGDPALDTVRWDGPGNLRVDYVLAGPGTRPLGAGLDWPAPDAHSRHAVVWADLAIDR